MGDLAKMKDNVNNGKILAKNTEEKSAKNIELEHFIYGSHEGYRMKAYSKGIDLDVHTEPFEGMFLPIKQSDVKTISEIRMILPVDGTTMLLSRVIKGGKDDHGRATMANHTAVIPKWMLKEGKLTYDDVDSAMVSFESESIDAIGDIPPLSVKPTSGPMDMGELKNYLCEDIVRNIIRFYTDNLDTKIFLYYRNSDARKRTRTAYLMSMLLDIQLDLVPLAAFTDVPYGGAKRIFNLVISRVMIDVKPGGDWVMLPVEKQRSWSPLDKKQFNKELSRVLSKIYR